MKALSLFSGIGGIDLACEWAGIETVALCEREPFCQKVLHKHWPNVPIYDDVCTLTKERLDKDGIGTIDLIHGGYPCQPFSIAGERRGEEDDRHLWPEYFRLVEEIRPRWVVGENVDGHINMGLDNVLSNLESANYTAEAIVLPASGVNAPTEDIEYSLLPTPQSVDWKNFQRDTESLKKYILKHQIHLIHLLMLRGFTDQEMLDIYEGVMGFPVGWTDLSHSEMQSFPNKSIPS